VFVLLYVPRHPRPPAPCPSLPDPAHLLSGCGRLRDNTCQKLGLAEHGGELHALGGQGQSTHTYIDDVLSDAMKQRVELHVPLDILLKHRDNNWKSLPALDIHVCRVQGYKLQRRLSARSVMQVTKDTANAEILWSGKLPLQRLVENRVSIKGGAVLRYRLHSSSDVTEKLGDALLTLSCRLTRKLAPTSLWYKALECMRDKHSSKFFQQKRKRFVNAVRQNSQLKLDAVKKKDLHKLFLSGFHATPESMVGLRLEQRKTLGLSASDSAHGGGHAILQQRKLVQGLECQSKEDREQRNRDRQVAMEKLERILEVVEGVRSETAQLRRETAQLERRQRDFDRQVHQIAIFTHHVMYLSALHPKSQGLNLSAEP